MSLDMNAAAIGFAREALLAGEPEAAVGTLRPVTAQDPGAFEPRYWLASALAAAGDGEAATQTLDDARVLHALAHARSLGADVARCRSDGDHAAAIGAKLYSAHHVAAASVIFGLAISAGHVSQAGLLTYGLSLQHQGRAEEAILVFRAAAETYPSAQVHEFMLYPHFMVEDGPARYAAEARRWAELYAPETNEPTFDNRPLGGRKLRIGYVAPSFAGTQLRQFIGPVLESHDPAAVEVFLYPAKAETEGDWRRPMAIQGIGHLPDAEAAALIRSDRIDVLVDCWGHSAGSRLPMFAHRCAPVQVAWINFVQTTGLKRMDYVLHADSMDAPGTAALFTEQVWPIGPICIPFRGAPDRPPVQPTPALHNRHITFGSFNHPVKLSDATVRAWGRILRERADARLILKYNYFADPVLRRVTQARFAAERIDPGRIVFRGWSTGQDYLREFADIDLALDPSPAPGGTTTCDALANGVPVVTIGGPDFYSRVGVQALEASGLPELVAESWDDYVERAVALTADVQALNALRARVRPGFENGPYGDEAGFTRHLEGQFAAMFERWLHPMAAAANAG